MRYNGISSQFRIRPLLSGLVVMACLAGCATNRKVSVWQEPGAPVIAQAEILSIQRNAGASARFHGKVRMKQPLRYRDLEVECFLLSFERDLSTLTKQVIEVDTHSNTLERQLKPEMDLFGGDNTPRLTAEFNQGRFREIDYPRYASPISVHGRIVNYNSDPANKFFYMIFDMMFSGDLATLVVETPERYRGTRLSLLNEENASKTSTRWSQVGAEVEFSTPESTLAWEPWGFTRIAELKDVVFPANQTK